MQWERNNLSGSSVGEVDVGDAVDEIEVRPKDYDKEFWNPLLNSDFWGSNVVTVIYNEDETVEKLKKKSGPYRYNYTTKDAFDHVVEVGGTRNVNADYGDDKKPWMGGQL